jgi:hypothetical protein
LGIGQLQPFIRPGMKRIKLNATADGLYASAFSDASNNRLVLVFVNERENEKPVTFGNNSILSNKK